VRLWIVNLASMYSQRRLSVIAPLIGALLLLASGVSDATAQPAAPRAPGLSAAGDITPPPIDARAAVLLEAHSGSVLFEQNAHEKLPPASLTKMATATVALEKGDPRQRVVASVNSMVEPTVIGLEPGDSLPLVDALYGLILNSGNDAALAIAESLGGGSIARFVGWMNAEVAASGLKNTHFANPHGLDVGEHYSSAFDMAIIGRILMRQPTLRAIAAEQRHIYDGPPVWAFRNVNMFLGAYPGADGIKTGYETRAGRCLAASASRDGHELIAVVLNSNRPVPDASALMDYGFARLANPPGPAAAPDLGRTPERIGRQLTAVNGSPHAAGLERAYLRGALRADLPAFDFDPGFQARPNSVYDRLVARSATGRN